MKMPMVVSLNMKMQPVINFTKYDVVMSCWKLLRMMIFPVFLSTSKYAGAEKNPLTS